MRQKRFNIIRCFYLITVCCVALLTSVKMVHGKDIFLRWEANQEPDLAGYKLYYKATSSGAPYSGTQANQGPSPIHLPLDILADETQPAYTVTGLSEPVDYFFVVTAYDSEGLESAYSNEAFRWGKGDVNGDGWCDAGDAVVALRYSVGLMSLTERQLWHGNVTCEGDAKVDSGDAIKILRYSVEFIDTLGCQ